MKTRCVWTEGLQMTATMGDHCVVMDAKKPLGSDSAATPKELLLSALCGCTAMDVVSLMRKYREPLERLSIDAEAESRDTHPTAFTSIRLIYRFSGKVDAEKAKEAVRLSETKYCSVSAIVSASVPIDYVIELNGSVIGRGEANFADFHALPRSGAA